MGMPALLMLLAPALLSHRVSAPAASGGPAFALLPAQRGGGPVIGGTYADVAHPQEG